MCYYVIIIDLQEIFINMTDFFFNSDLFRFVDLSTWSLIDSAKLKAKKMGYK